MLHAVIIDDEAKSRRILQNLLEQFCPSIKVQAFAEDVLNGVKIINKFTPDVVFLDIELPNYSGFKLIEFFDEVSFEIIFTTAFEQYAQQAIKVSAFDYLLKPIDGLELQKSIKKLEKKLSNKSHDDQNLPSEKLDEDKRFILPAQNGLVYIKDSEILYLESQGRYTCIYLKNNTTVTTTRNLKECEVLFEKTFLVRIHRSYVINLRYIKNYSKGRDRFVIMENEQKIDVGKNYKDSLNTLISLFIK